MVANLSSDEHRSERVRFYGNVRSGDHHGAADWESFVASSSLVVGSALSRIGEWQFVQRLPIFGEKESKCCDSIAQTAAGGAVSLAESLESRRWMRMMHGAFVGTRHGDYDHAHAV